MAWIEQGQVGPIEIKAQDNSAWGATSLRLTKPGTEVDGKGGPVTLGVVDRAAGGDILSKKQYADAIAPTLYAQTIYFDGNRLPAGMKPGDKVDITVTSDGAFDTTAPFTFEVTPVLNEAMPPDSWAPVPEDILDAQRAINYGMADVEHIAVLDRDRWHAEAKRCMDAMREGAERSRLAVDRVCALAEAGDYAGLEALGERGNEEERYWSRRVLLGAEQDRAAEQR